MKIPKFKLSQICNITMGQAPNGSSYNEIGEGYALIAGAGDFGANTPNPKKHTVKPTRLSVEGDLILCIRATIGDLNWSDSQYCLGRGVAGLRPIPNKLDKNYLWHFLQSYKEELQKKGTGSTFKQISRSHIEEIEVPLPPLEEQKRIAAILDKADTVRRKRQQAIELNEQLLRSVFLDMFGDPITNPKGWEITNINSISIKVTDGEHATPSRTSNGIKLLSARNIQDGYIDFVNKTIDFVPFEEYERLKKRCEPLKGDILISCSGSIGRVSIVQTDEPLVMVRSVALIKPDNSKICSIFLEGYLRSDCMRVIMNRRAKSSGQPNLFIGTIKELSIYLPPLKLQEKYSNIYRKLLKDKEILILSMNTCETFLNSLIQKAFRGELNKQRETDLVGIQ